MLVIRNKFRALERRERGLPFGDLRVELGEVGVAIFGEVCLMFRFDGNERMGVNRSCLLDALHAGFRVFTTTDAMSPFRSEDGQP